MFERYTERSRRVIFFARYEALQYGSHVIAPEHILLGLMREDKTLSAPFFPVPHAAHSRHDPPRRRGTGSFFATASRSRAELHLSTATKQILFYANDESRQLKNRHIGPEHLLLGIVREEKSVAAEILFGYGLRLQDVRDEMSRQSGHPGRVAGQRTNTKTPSLAEFTRDLTTEAAEGRLDPLVGREPEMERIIEILCRRTKNNPVLIGESGVGKTAIVEGLAQRIVDT